MLDKDETGRHIIKFDFDHVEAKKIKDVVCPLCGGEIVQTPFGFGCANYDKNDENSCRFSIGKMAGKDIPEAQIKELLNNGRTLNEVVVWGKRPSTQFKYTPPKGSDMMGVSPSSGVGLDFFKAIDHLFNFKKHKRRKKARKALDSL